MAGPVAVELVTLPVGGEASLPAVRDATRRAAVALGLTHLNVTRLVTAVSEVARNIYEYAGTGAVSLSVVSRDGGRGLRVVAADQGPGIADLGRVLDGSYVSPSGMGVGLRGARALVHDFEVVSAPGQGTRVTLTMWPAASHEVADLDGVRAAVLDAAAAPSALMLHELQAQNRELLAVLQALNEAKARQEHVNAELQRTNVQMSRLNADLEDKARRLLESQAALKLRNEELKGFAYTVSHDLKAPLRGIVGYAQELERRHQDGLGERARFCVAQILAAGRNLDRLIEDLLRYSRLDAETLTLAEVDVAALLQGILADRSLTIAELGAVVSVDLRVTTARMWERGMHQVLTNLIDNALKYSRQATPPRVHLAGEALDTAYRFSVRDNGIGFDMKYHDRIFGLFNRLTQAQGFDGTGAGLAIVKKLLDRQGGRVWAESSPGAGATFFVEVPRVPEGARE